MPVINKPKTIYRPPTRLTKESDPKPVSLLGAGRGGALMSFKEGQIK